MQKYVIDVKRKMRQITMKEFPELDLGDKRCNEGSFQKAIHVYSMAAMRIMLLVYQSRETPNLSCEVVLTKEQMGRIAYAGTQNSSTAAAAPYIGGCCQVDSEVRWAPGKKIRRASRVEDILAGLSTNP